MSDAKKKKNGKAKSEEAEAAELEHKRRSRVRELFKKLPEKERVKETAVLTFYAELQDDYPELVPQFAGDSYQHVFNEVRDLIPKKKRR